MQRVWLDTEFIRNNLTVNGLLSIGLTSESGKEYYAVNRNMDTAMYGLDFTSRQWMLDNVWPHFPGGNPDEFDTGHQDVRHPGVIRKEIGEYFKSLCPSGDADEDLMLYVNCGAQDVVRLHTLWENDWGVMPRWIPKYADDMARIRRTSVLKKEALPKQLSSEAHHALLDARHEKASFQFLAKYAEAEGVRP